MTLTLSSISRTITYFARLTIFSTSTKSSSTSSLTEVVLFSGCIKDGPELIGVVSAYIANRATGETLPGVAVVQDVTQFHDVAERFRTVDEAKSTESPPSESIPQREPATKRPPENETRA
jgi:hypothetical protein